MFTTINIKSLYDYWNISALTPTLQNGEALQILTWTSCERVILTSDTNTVIWHRSSYDFREDLKPELFQFQSLWRASVTKVPVSCPAPYHTMLSLQDEQSGLLNCSGGKKMSVLDACAFYETLIYESSLCLQSVISCTCTVLSWLKLEVLAVRCHTSRASTNILTCWIWLVDQKHFFFPTTVFNSYFVCSAFCDFYCVRVCWADFFFFVAFLVCQHKATLKLNRPFVLHLSLTSGPQRFPGWSVKCLRHRKKAPANCSSATQSAEKTRIHFYLMENHRIVI